jgi:hypothetical protein
LNRENICEEKMYQPSRYFIFFIISMGLVFYFGIRYSPASSPGLFKVEPPYLNGILTASGILFGIWAAVIGKGPETRNRARTGSETDTQKWRYSTLVRDGFFIAFCYLVCSVTSVALTSIDLFWSAAAILLCTISFLTNSVLIALTLYYYIFKVAEEP